MPAALRYRLPVRSFFLPCSTKTFPVQLRREFGVPVLDSASCFGDRNRNLAPECAKFPVFSQISGNSDQRLFRWGLHPPPRSRPQPEKSCFVWRHGRGWVSKADDVVNLRLALTALWPNLAGLLLLGPF